MRPWPTWSSRPEVRSTVLLGIVLVTAATLRLDGLGDRTLNHPEVYSPGIDLPWHLSNPNPRFTLTQTLKGSIGGEPHPPGYYILMLGWTKVFGSSIHVLRLPSVLFGVGSVFLVYLLARVTVGTATALLASAMLALNGFHVFWSQVARMYAMACFLGLLSTVLLVLLIRKPDRPRLYCIVYVAAVLSGLATHVYFWPLFITQVLWVLVMGIRTRAALVGLARVQILTFILATPLVAIAVYQKGAASRPPTLSPITAMFRYLQAGALFEMGPRNLFEGSVVGLAAVLALTGTLVLLTMAATAWSDRTEDPGSVRELEQGEAVRPAAMVSAALLMGASILVFAYVAKTLQPSRSTTPILAASVVPPVLALFDALLRRHPEWLGSLQRVSTRAIRGLPTARSLVLALAVVPVGLVAAVSVFSPMLVQRGLLIFAPYLLIILAIGLLDVMRRDRRWVALALMLAAVHGVSILHYKSRPSSPDYKGLAARWAPEIEATDLIFVHGRGHPKDWAVAPIYYYLNARRYRYVGKNFVEAVRDNPGSRVWVMSFPRIATEPEAGDALAGFTRRKRIEATGLSAELYVPRNSSP